MTNARKIALSATAALLAMSLAGCSVSLEDPTSPNGQPGSSGSSESPSTNPDGTTPSASPSASAEPIATLPKPAPLPTLQAGDKATYDNASTSATLATIIADSAALSATDGWYASFDGKVVGAFPNAKDIPFNSVYAIAPYNQFPAGKSVELAPGVVSATPMLVTAGSEFNAFASLLSILTPQGGTLTTFNVGDNPLSDSLVTAAGKAFSAAKTEATQSAYGTSKSFGKYTSTPNAFSVVLSPSTDGAFKNVTLWVEKVSGKDVIVGVNDVRIGYGLYAAAESGFNEHRAAITLAQTADNPVALALIGKYWSDRSSWWWTR